MTSVDFKPYQQVLAKFRGWIKQFDPRHASLWEQRFKDNPESAACEAMFWDVLANCGVILEPNADLDNSTPGPDFRCSKNTKIFYVEVTCIEVETVTEHTGLSHVPKSGPQHYELLNNTIRSKIVQKTTQCANLDAPCVLAIGTFHYHASEICINPSCVEELLTGEIGMTWNFDKRLDRPVGDPFLSTNFKSAAFNKRNMCMADGTARKSVSAILVAGFGCKTPKIYGAIHHQPVREFIPDLLDPIPFCIANPDAQSGSITTKWTHKLEP